MTDILITEIELSPVINPYVYDQLILTRLSKQFNEEIVFSVNGVVIIK